MQVEIHFSLDRRDRTSYFAKSREREGGYMHGTAPSDKYKALLDILFSLKKIFMKYIMIYDIKFERSTCIIF